MARVTAVFVLVVAASAVALGAEVDLVVRDGEMGSGVADVMMYQPDVVANVNYGSFPSMSTGINRWAERYACLVRFDLSEIPKGLKVRAATLRLHAAGGTYPYRDLVVTARAVAEANAGWIEGSGDGTRVPTPGAPSWNWLAYDTRRWAGEPGAAKAGVDYLTDWGAEALVPKEGGVEVAFELPPALVEAWIERPESNAGLRLYPESAAENGDVVAFGSSEALEPGRRPALELTLEGGAGAIARLERLRANRILDEAEVALAEGRAGLEAGGLPSAGERRLRQLERAIAEMRSTVAESADPVTRAREVLETQTRALQALAQRLPLERGRDWAAATGGPAEFALAVQRPTVKVFPRTQLLSAEFADSATVRLARNEHEATQVVVVPLTGGLEGLTWEISDSADPGIELSVAPLGFVRSHRPQFADVSPRTDWWPDPILSFMDEVDVRPGDVQPLWVDVHATEDARPGLHDALITVRARGVEARTMRLRIEVFDFALPVEQHLKTIWGMSEPMWGRFYGERYDDEFAWQFADMFLDHRMALADLYRTHPTGVAGQDSIYHFASVEAMQRLRERGSGWWNIGYVLSPSNALTRDPWKGMTYEQYLQDYVGMLQEELERVRAAHWPADRMGLYFLDETSDFEALTRAAQVMSESFPEIPLMTTGYDRSYGVDDTEISRRLDIWVPLSPRYHEDRAKIEQGRLLGKEAWWYICVGPRDPGALNWFVQYPAIRARLLMGAAARKYGVDGFLYYRVAGWLENDAPITGGPYSRWIPAYHSQLPDGDGQIICAGPDGPLATIRLENIRDGIEDYEYWWLLDELIASGDASPEALAAAEVPDELLTGVNAYSEDPELLEQVRLRVARAIESLQRGR
jgi:uncharacterized coiled-coil protein SlyX